MLLNELGRCAVSILNVSVPGNVRREVEKRMRRGLTPEEVARAKEREKERKQPVVKKEE